jgi:hypothetical protein
MTSRFRIVRAASRIPAYTLVTLLALFISVSSASAQPSADPSGHWEGSIVAPFGEIPIALDIARRDGQVIATYSRMDGSINGFPLSDVELTGNNLKLSLKANGGGVFHGTVRSATISGSFAAFAGTADFSVKRTGEARMAAPVVGGAISKALEGTWTAHLAAGTDSTNFTMTLASNPDGTSTGIVADDHGAAVPVKAAQDGAQVSLGIPAAHGSFSGTLSGDVIEGTYVEGALKAPLTFTRAR